MHDQSTSPSELPSQNAQESKLHHADLHHETAFDSTLQEGINLRLTEEKLRQELLDLRRPYLFRNPQLLTALITSVGALIGVFLLVEDNYFKIREQRNAFQQEQTLRLDAEARDAVRKADQARREAAAINTAAESTKADAAKTVHDANLRIANANASLAAARSRLIELTREIAVRQLANTAEGLVAAGSGDAARRAALQAWYLAETQEARQAVVHSYSLPMVVTLGSASLFHKNFSFSPHSDRIIIAGAKGATVWGTTSGKELLRIGPEMSFEIVVYSPNASRIATGDQEGKLVIWGASDGKPLAMIDAGHTTFQNLQYSTDGSRLLTTD